MATTISVFPHQITVTNLDTYNYTITTAGMHLAKIAVTVPPPSGMSVVIQLNGSPILTLTSPAASQSRIVGQIGFNAAVSDVLSFVLTSSTPSDQQLNVMKANLQLRIGTTN